MVVRVVVFFIAAGLCCPALSAEGGYPAATIVPPEPKLICRREAVTGTHVKKRVCRTEEQMAREEADAARQLKRAQDYRYAESLHRAKVQGMSH